MSILTDDPAKRNVNEDEELKKICYEKAHERYGKELPGQVKERLEDELEKIAKYGYAFHYLLAAKVAEECKGLGVCHLARGCAGASLVAFLMGITETNPLPPHFYCPTCGNAIFSYWELFDEEEPEAEDRSESGFDFVSVYQVKQKCKRCGHTLVGDGHDIPFEAFAGLHGEKQPDFDIEVPKEVQGKIFDFLEGLLGKDRVIHAGVKEFGTNQIVRHPGRVIIVPSNREIYDYTPVINIADKEGLDRERPTMAKDYHDLNWKVMTFDILGDPVGTSILSYLNKLERLTKVATESIPIDGVDYHSFFAEEKHKDIPMIRSISKNMLDKVFVCSFSDIVRMLGYCHGTGVWVENAEVLLEKEPYRLRKTIAHQEDVMNTLLRHGVDREEAYHIMEIVRKGRAARGLTEDDLQHLREKGISEEYIESMLKIGYLFPKAHDTEEAIKIFKLMWYKVHFSEEFEAVFDTN